MIKTFKIKITETLETIEETKAENVEQAEDMVREKYKKQEIVLTGDDFTEMTLKAELNPINNKCECGCGKFSLSEGSSWSAEIEDGELNLNGQEAEGFGKMTCEDCQREYDISQFNYKEINY